MSLLSSLIISDAFANGAVETATSATTQTSLASFIPLILIFLIFYFLLIRPQQKKMKEHGEMINNLKAGDKVYTSSGVFGVIKEIDNKENVVHLEIAKDVTIKVLRHSVGEALKDKEEKHSHSHKKSKKHK